MPLDANLQNAVAHDGASREETLRPVVLADQLETPSLDDRTYRVIRLHNKLEALLVHDSDTDKASAALDVNVGNFSDEYDMPGMAHAVEHVSTLVACHTILPSTVSLGSGV
jgi:insulysin